jgi:hypothetical protein
MRKRTWLISLGLTVSCAVAIALPAVASAEEIPYCGELVPAYTDCAVSPGHTWDYYNGTFDVNAAEYLGSGTVDVCEHVYRRSTGETVSDRCANGIATSKGDLAYYWEHGIELSGHAGNNSEQHHTIWGVVVR